MFRKIIIVVVLAAVVGLLVFGAVNRTLAKTGDAAVGLGGYGYNNGENGQGNGSNGRTHGARGNGVDELTNLVPATPGELSADESAGLIYMCEEEKLAHDVYQVLSVQGELPIFQNISQSEQAHTNSIKNLLDHYGLTDLTSSQSGMFTNPDLQALYNNLTARGSQSLEEALRVGAAIEEIDILDLEKRLAQTDNADIQRVYNNLLSGSKNHLCSFTTTLQNQTSAVYQPQYLSAEAYQTIISPPIEHSRPGKGSAGQSALSKGRWGKP